MASDLNEHGGCAPSPPEAGEGAQAQCLSHQENP